MRGFVILTVLVAVLAMGFAGCGQEAYDDTESGIQFAATIEDGADKYDPNQYACPVCDGQPISGDFYVDTDNGRVYFDKQECADKFEENPQQYLQQYQQKQKGAGYGKKR